MYPSTTFIIEDNSQYTQLPIDETVNSPLFMQVFSSDKGPEEMGVYSGEDFAKTFGQPNFNRYGQPLLQAQTLINNGARVLAKRVVAPDSTLANTIVLAKVKQESSQKTNSSNEPLYRTETNEETTVAEGNTAIMITKTVIKYELKTVEGNQNNVNTLITSALEFADYTGKTVTQERIYPLFLITDNGRGVSSKRFTISSNYTGSKNRKYLTYKFSVIEDSYEAEATLFTLNPNITSATSNLSLESVTKTYLKEIKAFTFDEIMIEFLSSIEASTGIEDIDNCDVLFGKTKAGFPLDSIEIQGDVNLSTPIGLPLQSGSNGSFGNVPIKSEAYSTALLQFFNGTITDDIYDVDNILLDGIIDANYPDTVKSAIESLVLFREDCFYFRDLGTDLFTSEDIITKVVDITAKSRYIGVYGNHYDVIDPYSKKQITVTMGYGLAQKLPRHFSDKRHYPLAGSLHNFVFNDIIEGTVNFLPKIIPGKNQKDELFSRHINFISYIDSVPTMESQYTNQEDYTGFSFINNTLAVQQIVKRIRTRCPKTRYSFMEEKDLANYKEDVQAILNNYSSSFKQLNFDYVGDKTYEQNMTFYAVIKLAFKNFVQAEVFRITAINEDDIVSK